MFSRWKSLALAGLVLALPASAAVVVAQSIEQMTHSAKLVVRGRVGQSQARWNEGHTQIWTYTELVVSERFKGTAPRTLLVRQPGGEIGEVGMRVSGAAQFVEGEDVVVFLEPAVDEVGVHVLVALAAAKVSLVESHTGELRARRDLEGLAFYGTSPDLKWRTVGGNDLGPAKQFLYRVRQAARQGGVQ